MQAYNSGGGSMYSISSAKDLLQYKKLVESGGIRELNAVLERDIDMSWEDWFPISVPITSGKIHATLDGNGHAINGLKAVIGGKKMMYSQHLISSCAIEGGLSMYETGLLFRTSWNFTIKNLTVSGELRIKEPPMNNTWVDLLIGGLTGFVDKDGRVENCRVETKIRTGQVIGRVSRGTVPDILPDGTCEGGIGGVAACSEGAIVNCVFAGTTDLPKFTGGIAFQSGGYIKDSYAESLEPEVYVKPRRRDIFKTFPGYSGIVDNISLYAPGKPYYTGSLKDFFASSTLFELRSRDILLDKPLKQSYWYSNALPAIAEVSEKIAASGPGYGTGEYSALALSTSLFQYCPTTFITDRKRTQSRYSAMLETLLLESPSFRRSFLNEYSADKEGVWERVARYITSRERLERLVRKAGKFKDYDDVVEADQDFIDEVYIR